MLDNFTSFNNLIILSEEAHQDLLPPDLTPDVYDHLILSVAYAYKKWNVTLITDDRQFTLVAKHYEVNTISGRQFMESHKNFHTEGKKLTEKYESLIDPSAAVINFHHAMDKKRLEERQQDRTTESLKKEFVMAIWGIVPQVTYFVQAINFSTIAQNSSQLIPSHKIDFSVWLQVSTTSI